MPETKQYKFVKHLARFAPREVVVTDDLVDLCTKWQSQGRDTLTETEGETLQPLFEAQKWKEVMIHGLHEEMARWWVEGWGWIYPIWREIEFAEEQGDLVMAKTLNRLLVKIEDKGLIPVVANHPMVEHEFLLKVIERQVGL